MHKLFRSLVMALVMTGAVSVASAGELIVRIADGRATVIARDVPVSQILAEWARAGSTRVVNGERLTGGPLTLELVDIPEKEALDILLRSAAGYMAAPRPEPLAGASLYDRVVILATSQPPTNPAPMAQPFNRPMLQQVVPQTPPEDDQGEPVEMVVPPPGMNAPIMTFPGQPGMTPSDTPGMPQPPVTSPRPGVLPQQPQPTQVVPYTPAGTPYTPPAVAPVPGQPSATWPGARPEGGP